MTAIAASPLPSPFAVFRNRNFSLMWAGQLVDTSGSALTSLAASILVFRITNSALSVGLMLMATAAPSVLVGLIAGVFVDRYDRKKIMIAANLIRAVLVGMIPVLVPINIAWLYVIVALSSAVGQFFDPAHDSVLPEIASDEELAAANSLMSISSFGATAIGFAASGLIASRFPIAYAFYLDAISFLFSGLCILLIPIKPMGVDEDTSVQMVLRNLRAGAKYLFDKPILRSLLYITAPLVIGFGMANALLLPFATRALHATEFEYGLQEGLTSVGFVAASLLMAAYAERLREGQWIAISYFGMALVGIIYSFIGSVPLAIGLMVVSGFFNSPSAIGRRLIVQRNTPREMRGRVNSFFAVTRDTLFLVGMAAAGLADLIDVRLMYLISSLLVLAAGFWVVVIPGLGQPAAEWKRALRLLRSAPAAGGLQATRAVTPADLDLLVGLLPTLAGLSAKDRDALLTSGCVVQTPAGATILQEGAAGDTAYFVLSGQTVAGVKTGNGEYRSLSSAQPGDFFGEIAALTGAKRTANVVAEKDTTLLQVPANTLRGLMANPGFSQLVLGKMTERLTRTSITELPRFAGYDQQALKELRESNAHEGHEDI